MTPEVKKRIEDINNGVVPEGYKKTKIGIIPDDWVERKGTELFEYIRNGFVGTVSPFYVEKGHKYIQGNNIKDGKIISDNLMYVNDEFYYTHQNSILKKGDIVIIQSGDVGKCALISDDYENANCHALIIMTPKNDTNSFYISYLLNSPLGHEMIKGFITGNVLHHILATDYKELVYFLPSLREQQKIASILSTQDELISLQERKVEELKELKKAYLQKMFPQNGSKYPELRFKEFTDTWEQRKLGDEAIEILAGGDIDKSKAVEKGKYPIYANALTNDGVVGYYDDYYRVKAPAVTVTGRGEVGFAQARMTDFTPVVRLLAIRSNHDCYFLENAINNHKVVVESTGVPQLTVPQLSSYSLFFPKNIEEETRIGEYFHNLDNLITLHQRKLESEKKKKKSLMQLLLTGKVRV